MEKYKVDYGEFSPFKGIRILFEYIEEGLDYAQKNNIKDVCVWTDGDWSKQTVDFDFLKNRNFIETFHWLVPISKKSDIQGLYNLYNLKNLRWDFDIIDLSNFPKIEELSVGFSTKVTGWEKLESLKELLVSGVKTEDLFFLQYAINLEYLRIIGGTFTSIAGIENCKKLKTLFLQKCKFLVDLNETLKMLPDLEQLNLEGCKKVNINDELDGIKIKNVSII